MLNSAKGEDHAAPQPQWPVHIDVTTGHGGKKRERENWSDKAQVGRTSPDAPQCQKNSEEKSSERGQAHYAFFGSDLEHEVVGISGDIAIESIIAPATQPPSCQRLLRKHLERPAVKGQPSSRRICWS